MITVGKLKNLIKKHSKDKNIPHQILYQNFMFERFLKRVSVSDHKSKFILKGGFLISSMIGIESRTTMDIDMTIKGIKMIKEEVRKIVNEIVKIDLLDGVKFRITNIEEIREDDKYTGFRLTTLSELSTLKAPFKLDFSTGDVITPKPILKRMQLLFEDDVIELWSYNIETILAEKLETILSRAELNTRSKDYYDVYIISKLFMDNFDNSFLAEALRNTMKHRNTINNLDRIDEILTVLKNSEEMKNEWDNYVSQNEYVGDIEFLETVNAIQSILGALKMIENK